MRLLDTRKLLANVLLGELPHLGAQHVGNLLFGHVDLIADWNEAVGKIQIIFAQQPDGHHVVIDVVKDERASLGVRILGLEEVDGLLAPMPAWVQVVSCVIAVVEAETVALELFVSSQIIP